MVTTIYILFPLPAMCTTVSLRNIYKQFLHYWPYSNHCSSWWKAVLVRTVELCWLINPFTFLSWAWRSTEEDIFLCFETTKLDKVKMRLITGPFFKNELPKALVNCWTYVVVCGVPCVAINIWCIKHWISIFVGAAPDLNCTVSSRVNVSGGCLFIDACIH